MKNFAEEIRTAIAERYPDAKVSVKEYLKNNDYRTTALCIFESDSNVSPTIRLEDYYTRWSQGLKTFNECVESIVETYERYKISNFNIGQYVDQYNPENILVKTVNLEANKEMLTTTPHFVFKDMALCFAIGVKDQFGRGGIVVSDEMFNSWHITMRQMLEDALNNLEPTVFRFDPEGILTAEDKPEGIPGQLDPLFPHVLTTVDGMYGASAIMRFDILKGVADKLDRNLFIVPLSIDEVLLVSDDSVVTPEQLKTILVEINRDVNPPEYVLSNNIYYFDRQKVELTLDGETLTIEEA